MANWPYTLKNSTRRFLENLVRLVLVTPVATSEAQRALTLPVKNLEVAF